MTLDSGTLKVSQPDLVIGKQGPELRGIFWVEEKSETSYFVIRLSSTVDTLILELDANRINSVLLGEMEIALGATPRLQGVRDIPGGSRSFAEWDVSSINVSDLKAKIGKAFGDEWQNALVQLAEAKSVVKGMSRPPVEPGIPGGCSCGGCYGRTS
jgi:hypothetical protein